MPGNWWPFVSYEGRGNSTHYKPRGKKWRRTAPGNPYKYPFSSIPNYGFPWLRKSSSIRSGPSTALRMGRPYGRTYTRTRRRRRRRRGRRRRPNLRRLARRVYRNSRRLPRQIPDLHYKYLTKQLEWLVNACDYTELILNDISLLTVIMDDVSTSPTAHMKVVSSKLNWRMRNNTNVAVHYQIYWCKPRHAMDATYLPESIMTTLISDHSELATNDLASTPTIFPEFLQHFRVKPGRIRTLEAGESHAYSMKSRPFQFYARTFERESYRIAKFSKIALIKAWGAPGVDDTTATQVGTSTGRIDIVATWYLRRTFQADDEYDIRQETSQLGALGAGWKGIGANVLAAIAESTGI